MKFNLRNNKKLGFTLIEILLVVGFIAVAGIGVYTVYGKVQQGQAANSEARNIDTIRAGVKNLFAGASDTTGLTNTIVNNGYGQLDQPQPYWLTGGIYLYSTQLENLVIENNILSENKYFQIGYSQDFKPDDFNRKNIKINHNLIFKSQAVTYPVDLKTWAKDSVYSIKGNQSIEANPQFQQPDLANFYLQPNSPALVTRSPFYLGSFSAHEEKLFWWLTNFPPLLNSPRSDQKS